MLIETPTNVQSKPHEMLSLRTNPKTQRLEIRINNSSLDLIQTCMRKAQYVLERGLTTNDESSALIFGSAIHKALETWYCIPQDKRNAPDAKRQATDAFLSYSKSLETSVDVGDKRSPQNGVRILENYFKKYATDTLEIVHDENGLPIVERRFEVPLFETKSYDVILFGTIDAILRDTAVNAIYVTDHKTTSALGSEFYNRLKPNHQYTAYIYGAQKVFNLNTNLFLVNGLQVAKTKWDLVRQVTTRDESDFDELKAAVRKVIDDFIRAKETSSWPMNAPNPCTMYGGCPFRDVCSASPGTRETMISGMFTTKQASL